GFQAPGHNRSVKRNGGSDRLARTLRSSASGCLYLHHILCSPFTIWPGRHQKSKPSATYSWSAAYEPGAPASSLILDLVRLIFLDRSSGFLTKRFARELA